MSYITLNYSLARKILANLDKCSLCGESNKVNSPWGVFRMYRSSERGRFYSVSGSSVFHNGGSWKMSTFRNKFSVLFK